MIGDVRVLMRWQAALKFRMGIGSFCRLEFDKFPSWVCVGCFRLFVSCFAFVLFCRLRGAFLVGCDLKTLSMRLAEFAVISKWCRLACTHIACKHLTYAHIACCACVLVACWFGFTAVSSSTNVPSAIDTRIDAQMLWVLQLFRARRCANASVSVAMQAMS